MYVFHNLNGLVEELRGVATDKRLKGKSITVRASDRLAYSNYAAGVESAISFLDALKEDSPDLFTIPTKWGTAHGTPGRTIDQLLKGFSEERLERSKPWGVQDQSGDIVAFFDNVTAAAKYLEEYGYGFVIVKNVTEETIKTEETIHGGPFLIGEPLNYADSFDPLDPQVDEDALDAIRERVELRRNEERQP